MKRLLLNITLSIFAYINLSFVCHSSIIGTWISEEDSKWKMVFTNDNKCFRYYNNNLRETDTCIISNTSPQCGETVPVDSQTSYLRLTNVQNINDVKCYEINGITDSILSIRPLENTNIFVFIRQ